jgi:hypothetical protein
MIFKHQHSSALFSSGRRTPSLISMALERALYGLFCTLDNFKNCQNREVIYFVLLSLMQ